MSDQSPAPADAPAKAEAWSPPESDQEFVFENIDSVPAWVDKNWASYSMGPALAVPAGDIFGTPPYTTNIARSGDTVMFKIATPSKPAHLAVVPGEPVGEGATLKPPQASAAALEDMIRTGVMVPDDLSDEARGQLLSRSPHLRMLVDEGKGAPKAVPVEELVKIA